MILLIQEKRVRMCKLLPVLVLFPSAVPHLFFMSKANKTAQIGRNFILTGGSLAARAGPSVDYGMFPYTSVLNVHIS